MLEVNRVVCRYRLISGFKRRPVLISWPGTSDVDIPFIANYVVFLYTNFSKRLFYMLGFRVNVTPEDPALTVRNES